jgi:hypothetical protein
VNTLELAAMESIAARLMECPHSAWWHKLASREAVYITNVPVPFFLMNGVRYEINETPFSRQGREAQ